MNSATQFEEEAQEEPSNSISTRSFVVLGVVNTPGVYKVTWGPRLGQ